MKYARDLKELVVLATCMALAGCYQIPGPETPDIVSAEHVPVSPDLIQQHKVSILYAQIGIELTSEGLVREPTSTVRRSDDFYALGVFKGRAKSNALVEISIVDGSGDTVYRAKKHFTPRGERALLFEVRGSDIPLDMGEYRVFFALNSIPCWELPLTVL